MQIEICSQRILSPPTSSIRSSEFTRHPVHNRVLNGAAASQSWNRATAARSGGGLQLPVVVFSHIGTSYVRRIKGGIPFPLSSSNTHTSSSPPSAPSCLLISRFFHLLLTSFPPLFSRHTFLLFPRAFNHSLARVPRLPKSLGLFIFRTLYFCTVYVYVYCCFREDIQVVHTSSWYVKNCE